MSRLEEEIEYREATGHDLGLVVDLYKKGLIEMGAVDLDLSLVNAQVYACYHLAPCFVMVKNGNIVGIAGLTTKTASWSGVATLCDYMFYVLPEHRNLKSLGGLVNKCKKFAKSHGMPLRLEFICNNDEKLRKRLFRIHGFDVVSITGEYNG